MKRLRNPLPTICAAPFVRNKLGRPENIDGSEEQRQLWVGTFAEDEDVEAWIEKLAEIRDAVVALNNQLSQAEALYGMPQLRPREEFEQFQAAIAELTSAKLFPEYTAWTTSDREACRLLFEVAQFGLALCKQMSAALEKYNALSQLDPGSGRVTDDGQGSQFPWMLVLATGAAGGLAYLWLRAPKRKMLPPASDSYGGPIALRNPRARRLTR